MVDENTQDFIDKTNDVVSFIYQIYIEEVEVLIKKIYHNYTKQLESIVVLHEDMYSNKNIKPIQLVIPTKMTYKIQRLKYNKVNVNVDISAKSDLKVENDILIAAWHGTGMGLSNEIVQYIVDHGGNKENARNNKGIPKYYFEPTSADIQFKNKLNQELERMK